MKNTEQVVEAVKEVKRVGTCGCGRSPTGDCCGWHALSEDTFRQKLAEYDAGLIKNNRQFGG